MFLLKANKIKSSNKYGTKWTPFSQYLENSVHAKVFQVIATLSDANLDIVQQLDLND